MSDNPYKKLGGQTVIYGLGTLVPRLLNYLILTIYYTRVLEVNEFGIITELYAYISIFLVILTLGLETGYFKFSLDNKNNLFFTSFFTLTLFGLMFISIVFIFINRIADTLDYNYFPVYIKYSVLIVSIDAVTNIFIAKLRIEEKMQKFIIVQLLNVILTISLVLFFIEILPSLIENKLRFSWLNYRSKVYYILFANLLASIVRLAILFSELKYIRVKVDLLLLKKLLIYSLPLLLAQLSGIFNESLDRILLRYFLPSEKNILYEIGIYGANFRIAVLMTLFIQMFRYAAEPFYFANYKAENSKNIYAEVMKYFIIFCMIIFLMVTIYINYFKFFIDLKFHEGLRIVPIILFSSVLTGVIFNLSIWYKLSGKTYYGIYIICSGAVLTIILNYILIPLYGYYGCAITHLVTNIFMVILSYLLGQKSYKIPYNIKKILVYMSFAILLYSINYYLKFNFFVFEILKNTLLFLLFIFTVNKEEKLFYTFLK